MVFQEELKKCQGRVKKKVSMAFQNSFKGVSRKIDGDISGFQGYLKNFKGNFREVSRVFHYDSGVKESFKCVSRKFHKIVLDPKFFKTQNFFGPNFFLNSNFV